MDRLRRFTVYMTDGEFFEDLFNFAALVINFILPDDDGWFS